MIIKMNESPAQIEEPANGISIVDLIKQAYEKGLFKKLKCDGRKNAARMDISGLDKDRLIAYFDKRSEFNREDNTESGIHSAEFISDEFDIEIFDSFIQIYKLVDNESIQKLTIDDLQKLLSEDADLSSDMYCVYRSSSEGCYKEFTGTKKECEQWISNNKNRFPSFVRLTIQSEGESPIWARDFDTSVNEDVDGVGFKDSTAFWYTITTRSMWDDDINKRASFTDETYHSLRNAMEKAREFSKTCASHVITGVEEVYAEPNMKPVKTGAYWELRRGEWNLITSAYGSTNSKSNNDSKSELNEHAYDDVCRKVEQEVLNGEREVIAVDVDEWFDMMDKYQLKELDNLTTDISQGTGNVIVYYGYNVNNDTVYKYASY